MAVRKSKLVGQTINNHTVIDSRRKGRDTELLVECQDCKKRFWKSRGYIKNNAKCPYCQNGKNYRNANGHTHERLYERYRNIIRRVNDPSRYKGITICDEWKNNYLAFKEWALNHGYDDALTIDRIDNNKGYEPNNCRWVTMKKQANNRRNNHIIEYNGKKYTISEFAEYIGLPYNTVLLRIARQWDINDVVKTPYKSRKKWSEINDRIKN